MTADLRFPPNSPQAWAAAKAPGAMPETRQFTQAMRQLLGNQHVDAILRAARDGQPVFHAIEDGIELGVPAGQQAPLARLCIHCQGWSRPGASDGYCGAGRADLTPAYGDNHPLRRLPADRGANCREFLPC